MAQQVTSYRSDAGIDFPTEREALRDDLRHYIFNVIKNEPLTLELTDRMIADMPKTADILTRLDALTPITVELPLPPSEPPTVPPLENMAGAPISIVA